MRFTAVINLPFIVLAIALGAAALPRTPDQGLGPDPLAMGPSHNFFLSALNLFIFHCLPVNRSRVRVYRRSLK